MFTNFTKYVTNWMHVEMLRIKVFLTSLIFSNPTFAEHQLLDLTRLEQQWITEHPVVCYTSAADYVSDNRTYYIDQIALLTGLHFEKVETENWSETRRLVALGQIDLVTAVTNDHLDSSFFQEFLKSDSYYLSSTVAVTRKHDTFKITSQNVADKTVAVIGTKMTHDYLRRNLARIMTVLPYDDPTIALEALAGGQVDAIIGPSLQLQPIIKDKFFGAFQWVGTFPGRPIPFVMGISSSSPELASTINKAIKVLNLSRAEPALDRLLLESDMVAPTWSAILKHYSTELLLTTFAISIICFLAVYSRRAQQSAQQSAADKSAFLAVMSHEIRSPMNGVMSSIELLQTTKLTSQQRDLIELANASALNLLCLLDDVLDISKLEAGVVILERSPTNLQKIAHNLASIHRLSASKRNTSLTLSITGLKNILLVTSPTRLQQIISNLLSNAVKFTKDGNIELSITFNIISSEIGQLRVQVSDTGIGIDRAQQGRLFQAFVQADNSISRRYGGSGLGLSISKHLAELMGGDVTLDSELGQGTQVSFTAPVEFRYKITPTYFSAPPQLNPVATALTQLHILVVEDDPYNQKTIGLQLNELGYRALIVENGIDALKIVTEKHDTIAIVLLDCHLPGMDGYEVARRIRQQQESMGFAHLPIIAISASTNTGHQQKCIDSGIDGNLSKPLSLLGLKKLFGLWLTPDDVAPAATIQPTPTDSLYALFLRTITEDIVFLREALEIKDLARALHYAHRLHGAALSAQVTEIAATARILEDLLRQSASTGDDWLHLMNSIEKALDDLIETY